MLLDTLPMADVWEGSPTASRLSIWSFIRPDLIGLILKLCGQVEEESENCIRESISETRDCRNKRIDDLKVRIQNLQPGDQVLLRNLGIPGKHKLADWWSSQPYIVCEKLTTSIPDPPRRGHGTTEDVVQKPSPTSELGSMCLPAAYIITRGTPLREEGSSDLYTAAFFCAEERGGQ